MYTNALKDALYCLSPRCGSVKVEYCRGMLVGIVSAMQQLGKSFDFALGEIMANLPYDWQPECMPESWQKAVDKYYQD